MQRHSQPLPVAVIGCGRMGRLHARAYSQLPGAKLVGVCDIRREAAESAAAEYQCSSFASPGDLLPLVRAVSIAVPTQHHLAIAEPFLRRGIACLIEKPLAATMEECHRIVELSERNGAVVQAGHIERFNPAYRALRQLSLTPRFIEAVRVSPFPFRSMDVGVVLDMMIHDIDLVLGLASSAVKQIDAVGAAIVGAPEDMANVRLAFDSGCVATLTASRLALATQRTLRVFGPQGYVSLDLQKRSGQIVQRDPNLDALRSTAQLAKEGGTVPAYIDLIKAQPLQVEEGDPIRWQLQSFLETASGHQPAAVSATDGLAAVELAHRILKSLSVHSL